MATKLESAVKDIMDIFKQYAQKGGNPKTLEKEELKELFRNEMKKLTPEQFDKLAEKIMKKDVSKDIDFSEYLRILFSLAACNESQGCPPSKGHCEKSCK